MKRMVSVCGADKIVAFKAATKCTSGIVQLDIHGRLTFLIILHIT